MIKQECGIVITIKRRKHKSNIRLAVKNIINSNFKADKLNLKWLIGINEFHRGVGKGCYFL